MKDSLTAHQYIDRGNIFINPIGKLIVEMPYPRQSMKQPKPYSILVAGEAVEPDPQHRMDQARKPDRLYQEVRDDLAKYAPIEVTRVGLRLVNHAYVGVIDSDGVPFRFTLNSRGLKITPVAEKGHAKAFLELDELVEAEQRRALDRRRVEAAREQARISKETSMAHPNLVVVEKSVKMTFADEHQPLVITPRGGSNCGNCKWVNKEKHGCENPGYVAAEVVVKSIGFKKKAGSHELPDKPLDEMCSDWWAPRSKKVKKSIEELRRREASRAAGERYAAEMRAAGAEIAAQCGEEDLDPPRPEDALVIVEKALPKKSKDKPVKKTPSKKASTKKVGSKGNIRYGYPQEKGSPPAQAAPANPVKVPREPEGDPEVDPTEFANHFGLSVDTMRRVASRFATNEKLNGREGFVSFMKREMASAAKKHRLDGDFWGLLFDALMQPSAPAE